MKTIVSRILILLFISVAAPLLRAWNEPGHQLSAAMAYGQLTSAQKSEVDGILRRHTNHVHWLAEFHATQPGVEPGMFIFMEASLWPDEIRESRQLSLEKAYRPLPRLDGRKNKPVLLPDGYRSEATKVAQRQAALAAYRLADCIGTILIERGENPTP